MSVLAAFTPEQAAAVRLVVYITFAGLLLLVALTTAYLLLRGRRVAAAKVSRNRPPQPSLSAWEIAGRRPPPSPPLPAEERSLSTGDTVDLDPDDPGSADIGPDDVDGDKPR